MLPTRSHEHVCFWWWQHKWSKWSVYGTGNNGMYIFSKRDCPLCGRTQTRMD